MLKVIAFAASASLALSSASIADEHRELGPHEHGHGTLNLAIEGSSVKMELEVPGADIVGFEHAPSTADQKDAVDKAKQTLSQPLALFKVPADAKCTVKEATVKVQEEEHEHGEEGEKEAKGSTAHHNEFFVEYALDCSAVDALTSLGFDFFKSFENAKILTVNVITSKGQSKFEVTPEKPMVDLTGLM